MFGRSRDLPLMLSHPDVTERLEALEKMLRRPGKYFEALGDALHNDAEEVRLLAAKRLLFLDYINKEVELLSALFDDASPAVQEAARNSVELLKPHMLPDDWMREIERLQASITAATKWSLVRVKAPSLGSNLARFAAGALLGGGNVGAMAAMGPQKDASEGLLLPDTCCLCDIYPAEKTITITQQVTTSMVGSLLGGPALGERTISLPVPLCKYCAGKAKRIPCVFRPKPISDST